MAKSTFYTTFHIQLDRRITLGTAIHLYKDCSFLNNRTVSAISGEIVQKLPKCTRCYDRLNGEK